MMKTNIPEIGKTYAFFDDGKTGFSRNYKEKKEKVKK